MGLRSIISQGPLEILKIDGNKMNESYQEV